MEDSNNLLDEFALKESELMLYIKAYQRFKKLGIFVSAYACAMFLVPTILLRTGWENYLLGHTIGTALGFTILISGVSALLGFVIASFIDKKIPYRHRYSKSFWIVWLVVSGILTILCTGEAFSAVMRWIRM